MDIKLDERAIFDSIKKLENLDLKKISIKEIEEILIPLFKGYVMAAPSLAAGTLLYRGRKCSKPIYFKEITYPDQQYITRYGRANDIGQPMFYAATGKNVPFYELDVKVGEQYALSTWRVKTELMLNHVGFTEETQKVLSSKRQFKSMADFIEMTRKYGDLNTSVYNYLARIFTQKVSADESHLYKLSVAITNKLINGDFLHGIIYPTIAMFGNADNIVIKPQIVDTHLEFVSVEHLEIMEFETINIMCNTIDTSTKINSNGNIMWSGKLLGGRIMAGEPIKFEVEGAEWISKDGKGKQLEVQPILPIPANQTSLFIKYARAFSNCVKVSQDIFLENGYYESFTLKFSLIFDFEKKHRFLCFYVPVCSNPQEIIAAIPSQVNYFTTIEADADISQGIKIGKNIKNVISSKDLLFSKTIYIYSEIEIETPVLEFDKNGIKAVFIFNTSHPV